MQPPFSLFQSQMLIGMAAIAAMRSVRSRGDRGDRGGKRSGSGARTRSVAPWSCAIRPARLLWMQVPFNDRSIPCLSECAGDQTPARPSRLHPGIDPARGGAGFTPQLAPNQNFYDQGGDRMLLGRVERFFREPFDGDGHCISRAIPERVVIERCFMEKRFVLRCASIGITLEKEGVDIIEQEIHGDAREQRITEARGQCLERSVGREHGRATRWRPWPACSVTASRASGPTIVLGYP